MNAPSPGFAVAQLTPAVGGLVTGLDLDRPLSDSVVAKLKAAVAIQAFCSDVRRIAGTNRERRLQAIAYTLRCECPALRNFNSADVRVGSNAAETVIPTAQFVRC